MKKKLLIIMCVAAVLIIGSIVTIAVVKNKNSETASEEIVAEIETTEAESESISETEQESVSESESESSEINSTESEKKPEEGLSELTIENYPVFDGSTATKPLVTGLTSLLLGIDRDSADDMFGFHKTDEAYNYLERGEADILVVAEGCKEVMDKLEARSFWYEMEPIANEGLVFVVNANNPVDSLTIDQVKKIYTGEITNWSQVGGEVLEIKAFQRNEESGSQVMMRKCVMNDCEMMEAPTELIPAEMGELIDAVAGYDNSGNALGYTVYYYADSMKMADGLKILKIDGIEPNNETIGSKEYPFTNPYYCVISKAAGENSPQRLIYDWFVTEEGQKLVEMEGYIPYK